MDDLEKSLDGLEETLQNLRKINIIRIYEKDAYFSENAIPPAPEHEFEANRVDIKDHCIIVYKKGWEICAIFPANEYKVLVTPKEENND